MASEAEGEILQAIYTLAHAVHEMAESNAKLAEAIVASLEYEDSEDDDEAEIRQYLDGSKIQ